MKKFTFLFVFAFIANLIMSSTAFGQILQRGSSTNGTSTNTSLLINKPTGVVSGDVMIVNIAQRNNGANAPTLAGWLPIASGAIDGGTTMGALLYKVAGGSEPASYTFTLGSGANNNEGTIVAFSGVDVSGPTPFDVAPGSLSVSNISGTTATATGIITATANAAVIMFAQADNNQSMGTWSTTSPVTLTELYEDQYNPGGSNDLTVGAASEIKATAGATGNGTMTVGGSVRWGAMLIALKPMPPPPPTVTINPPALSISTILVGGTLPLTTTRSANGTWSGGNGNFTYTWSSTGPSVVSFTSNPNTIAGTSSSTTASNFTVAGTYTIKCTVSEDGGGLTVISSTKTVNVLASAPTAANLWATSSDGDRVSSFVVSNGTYFAGPTNIFDPFPSTTQTTAALGRNDKPSAALGHFYWLPNDGTNGVVNVYASTSTGTSITLIGTLDVNGASNNALGFVRLGMGPDGTGWILAGDGTTLYLAKFMSNGVNPVTIIVEDAAVGLVNGLVSTFVNGDICVSGSGNIFALANNGSGVTQIFTGAPNGSSTILTKTFDLIDNNGAAFTGTVNGVAFDLLGSIYLSTGAGLYFIDQNTVNGPAGTVGCFLVSAVTGLQDLASNVFPSQSTLPVKLGTFIVTKQGNNAVIDWTTLTEANTDHFEIERSFDGVNYTTAGTKRAVGNSASETIYQYIDPITTSSKIIYYRLKTVDIDAKKSLSKIVALRLNGIKVNNFTVFPNPFTNDLKVQISSDKETNIFVRISNSLGQQVVSRNVMLQSGENIVVLNSELASLKSGMYLLELVTEEGKMTQKIIKR